MIRTPRPRSNGGDAVHVGPGSRYSSLGRTNPAPARSVSAGSNAAPRRAPARARNRQDVCAAFSSDRWRRHWTPSRTRTGRPKPAGRRRPRPVQVAVGSGVPAANAPAPPVPRAKADALACRRTMPRSEAAENDSRGRMFNALSGGSGLERVRRRKPERPAAWRSSRRSSRRFRVPHLIRPWPPRRASPRHRLREVVRGQADEAGPTTATRSDLSSSNRPLLCGTPGLPLADRCAKKASATQGASTGFLDGTTAKPAPSSQSSLDGRGRRGSRRTRRGDQQRAVHAAVT